MGTGRPSLKRPLHVPVSDAHTRITENVRRVDAGFHLSGADDVDQIARPTDGHAYFYDTASGLFKPMLAPPFLKFNYPSSGGTVAVSVQASDEDPVAGAGKIINVNARLKTAGSSTTTAILKKNASTVITTFTFASGSHTATWTTLANTTFAASDYFWVDLTAAGTGAQGLVIAAWATAA